MGGADWRSYRGMDKRRLSEARLQAHYAVQWLARTARAYIQPQPDDGHTSLLWDRQLDGLTTQALPDGTRLSLQFAGLTLALHGGDGPAQSLSLHKQNDAQARQWLGAQLAARGFAAHLLDAASPYEMPSYAIAAGAAYDAVGCADALQELAAWYGDAELLLSGVQRQMLEQRRTVSPVCCWPHHFDIATLITLPTHASGMTGYVGAGLSPGDHYYDEPYYYVSVYPRPDAAALPRLPALGHWHTHEFTAAVATAQRIMAAKDQMSETDAYLRGSVAIAIQLLS
ncbi:MAG: hypothetical protein HY244_03275 [Rhizobiales bacterium]|nr:hypothetical protein [Hyphomicrobiales bacterium]